MNKENVIREIRNNEGFYVYGLLKDGMPFYIGMGQNYRIFDHEYNIKRDTNIRKKEIIEEQQNLMYELYAFVPTKDQAIQIEKELIKYFGRIDLNTGILTNKSSGGEWPTEFSDETKEKIRNIKLDFYKNNEEFKQNQSSHVKDWIKNNPESFELQQKLSTESKRKPNIRKKYRDNQLDYIKKNPDKFKKSLLLSHISRRTPEGRKRNSEAQKKYFQKPGSKEKASQAQLKWRQENPERAQEILDMSVEAKRTPEARKKNSNSRKEYIQNNPDKEAQRLEKMRQTLGSPEGRESNRQRQLKAAQQKKKIVNKCKQLINQYNLWYIKLPDGRASKEKFQKIYDVLILQLI